MQQLRGRQRVIVVQPLHARRNKRSDRSGDGIVNHSFDHIAAKWVVTEALRRHRQTEVAVAIGLYRDCIVDGVDHLLIAILLPVEKEERLVVAIVKLAEINWSAKREAIVI